MKGVHNPAFHALLTERFGVEDLSADAPPFLPAARHQELARVLQGEFGYTSYGFVVASHWEATAPKKSDPDPEHFEVATGLRTVGRGSLLACWRVRLELPGGDTPGPTKMPTLVGLFAGADWQEREQFDLVGVSFDGHPDERRLMLPEDWDGHPLRKDYAIDTPHPPWR